MATSRYNNTRIIRNPALGEPAHFATYDLPELLKGYADIDWFSGQPYHQHEWTRSDRLDKLASKYFGEDDYWWIIALVNNITYPLGIKPGTIIRVPADVDSVLRKLNLR